MRKIELNELAKERIYLLAQLIENEEHVKKFSADSGFNMSYVTHECGTPSCIAGYAVKAAEADPTFDENSHTLKHSYWIAGSYLLGRSNVTQEIETMSALFDPNTPLNYSWDRITPKQAAEVMRNFAHTGIIDWSPAWKDWKAPVTVNK